MGKCTLFVQQKMNQLRDEDTADDLGQVQVAEMQVEVEHGAGIRHAQQSSENLEESNLRHLVDEEETTPTTKDEIPPSRGKRFLIVCEKIPIIRHIASFLVTYGSLFLFNHAYRWIFFMNLISGLGNFFSEIAIVNLLETRGANGTLTNSTSHFNSTIATSHMFSSIPLIPKMFDITKPLQEMDVMTEGASGSEVSGVFISLLLPGIFLMPITGMVADLFDRRKILLISDVARGFIVTTFLVVYFVGVDSLQWLVYLTVILQYSFSAFFEPSREALVPLVVPKKDLPIANALDSLCWLAVSFFGSSLGGITLAVLGAPVNFALDSFSFFLSGFFSLLLFRYPQLGRRGIDDRLEMEKQDTSEEIETVNTTELEKSSKKQEKELLNDEGIPQTKRPNIFILMALELKRYFVELFRGIVFFSKNPLILTSALVKGSGAFFWFSVELILIKMVYEVIVPNNKNLGGLYFGIAKSFSGIGSGLMPVILERVLPRGYTTRTMRGIIVGAMIGFPITFSIYYVASLVASSEETRLWGFAILCLSSLTMGMSGGTIWSFSITHLQIVCPNEYLGRAFSIDIGFWLNTAGLIGMVLYGTILDDLLNFSVSQMILVEIGLSVVACVIFIAWFIIFRNNIQVGHTALEKQEETTVEEEVEKDKDQILSVEPSPQLDEEKV